MRNTPYTRKEQKEEYEVHQRYILVVKGWGGTGFAILLTSSILVFIVRAISCNEPLRWYEILIFGLVISAILVIFTLLTTDFHSIPLPHLFGITILGPIGAFIGKFIGSGLMQLFGVSSGCGLFYVDSIAIYIFAAIIGGFYMLITTWVHYMKG